jgi:hypothetical protein
MLLMDGRIGMSMTQNVRKLREKVARYRDLARLTTDPETAKQILELTNELEQQARDIERGK